MNRLLLASREDGQKTLLQLLVPRFFAHSVTAASAAHARRLAPEQPWDLVLINAPLPDEAALALAQDLAADGRPVLLLAEAGAADKLPVETEVFLLQKPVGRQLLEQTLHILAQAQARCDRLAAENRRLAAKLEETRLVGRAKCALVAYRDMTENEAHRYIEKQAMDTRLPRRDVARDILEMFGV